MKHDQSHTNQSFEVIGQRVPRPDGVDKVTGRARYGADANAPGQLTGLVLRSPHPHARIKKIDTSKAEKLPGVKAVITADDLPDLTGGQQDLFDTLENCMARDRALYDGHAVAAVAAIDRNTAKRALKLIKVSYEKLPHVTDVDEAMNPDAPIVQPRIKQEGKPSNIVNHAVFGHGDMDEGLKEADVVVEKSYKTEQVHQGYIEPHACLASVIPDGTGELWVTTQGHFHFRNVCATLLGMDAAKLKVTSSEIGGGFGGKTIVFIEPLALALSRKANRPVKMVMSREEVFRATGPAPATSLDVKVGARKDGTITYAFVEGRYLGGAFPGISGIVGALIAWACYDLKNVKTVGIDLVSNRPKVAPYRAPCAPMMNFAVESTLDILAAELDMDPVALRLKNAAREGSRKVYGEAFGPPNFGPIGLVAALEAVRDHPHMKKKLGKNQGRGMACGFWFNAGGQTCIDLNVGVDGTVSLTQGTVDIGGARASIAMIAAEELGIPYDDVKSNIADTASLGHNDTTEGSRGTFSSGMAAIFAARDIIEVLKERAAKMWDIPVDQITWKNGEAHAVGAKHSNKPPLSFKEIASKSPTTGGPIAGHHESTMAGEGAAFTAHICDVEVDPETGRTSILRYTAVQDAGKAIHPDYVEGQMQGGAAQGIGWALNEEYIYGDDGCLQNPGFLDYRIPVCSDLPFIDTVILEIPNPNHPYGIRGVGEAPIVPPLAAVGNAISNAVGVRLDHTPMSPPRILKALDDHCA